MIGRAREIAPKLHLTPGVLLRLAREKKIPSIRLGRRTVLFRENAVRAALEKFEVHATEAQK